ncbi:MAG: 2'-5' RNA ligase family protein [Polaromonas sp.]|nr:2'-5' RNA ligase family protein [Polaromonas sp.]
MLALGAEIKSRHQLAGKLHLEDRLHLTLDHLGDFESMPSDIVRHAIEVASELAAQCHGFAVRLDQTVSFGRGDDSRPVVLRDSSSSNAMLAEFRSRLWDALAARGVPGGPRSSFTPHVSLLYDRQVLQEEPAGPIGWQAGEFVLIHSALKQTHYDVMGRWVFQPI